MAVVLTVAAIGAFAFLCAGQPCIEALAVLLLALGFLAVAGFVVGGIPGSVFPNGPYTFYFLPIIGVVAAFAAGALFSADFPHFEALTI